MIKKFRCQLTIDIKGELPETENQWEKFCINLESEIEKTLENNICFETVEAIIEEI